MPAIAVEMTRRDPGSAFAKIPRCAVRKGVTAVTVRVASRVRRPRAAVWTGIGCGSLEDRPAAKRNRRHSRSAQRQAAAGRLGGAPVPARRGRRCLAGRRRRQARGDRSRRRARRMVDRPRRRRFPPAHLLSWRGLLLGFDRQPPPDGDRGRTGRGPAHAGGRVSPRPRASVSGRARRRADRLAAATQAGLPCKTNRRRRRQRGREFDARAGRRTQARGRGPAGLPLARLSVDRSRHVGRDAREQERGRSPHS